MKEAEGRAEPISKLGWVQLHHVFLSALWIQIWEITPNAKRQREAVTEGEARTKDK